MSRSAETVERAPSTGPAKKSTWGWRRLLLIVVCLALGLAAGVAYYLQTPKTYQASATVLVLPTATGLDAGTPGGSTDINMETEAELARSTTVAFKASELLAGGLTSSDLLKRGSVTVPVNSQVINFSVLAPSAELAADGANAWANAYLDRRNEQAKAAVRLATQTLNASRRFSQHRLDQLKDAGASDALIEVQTNRLTDINKQLILLRVGSKTPGEIISLATEPTKPAAPQLPLAVGAGLLAGAALAVGLILLGAVRRSHSVPNVEPTTERRVPVLASVSGTAFGGSGVDDADLRRTCREIAALEAEPGPVALIGGADPATATHVAMQLGTAWASEFGASVVVATDSTARDSLPVTVRDRPGVFDLLVNGVSPSDCAARLPNSRALLIGPGSRASATSEVSGQRLTQMWAQLDREFGTVLVSAAHSDSPIASMTVRTAGPVVGIVRADRGREQDVAALLDQLDHLAAADRLVGVILVEDGDVPTFRAGGSPVAEPRPVPESDGAESGNVRPFDPDHGTHHDQGGDEEAGSAYDQLSSGFGSPA